MSIEELESKMKKIYEENKVLVEGEYTVLNKDDDLEYNGVKIKDVLNEKS